MLEDNKPKLYNGAEAKAFFSKNQNVAALLAEQEKDTLGLVKKYNQLIVWEDNYWKTLSRPMDKFYNFFGDNQYRNWTESTINDILFHLRNKVGLKTEDYTTPFITLNDKLLNTEKFTFEEIDKNKFSFTRVDINSAELEGIENWKLEDTNSRFSKFIKEIMVTEDGIYDPELSDLLQESCGYCFYPNVSAEASFFYKGDGANGKGVLMYLLEKIMGEEFVSATNIETLTKDKWAVAELIGKKINICSENESDLVNSAKFKALVSGDPIRIEKKYEDSYKAPLAVKFIFSTNDFPKFSNFDKALIRRLYIIPFNLVLEEEQRDSELKYKMLREEKEVITKWFLQGLYRIIKNKLHFTKAKQSLAHLEIETENNLPSLEYFNEMMERTYNYDNFVDLQTVYTNYNNWCKDNGRKPIGSKRFAKELKQNLKIKDEYKWIDEQTKKCLMGVRYKTSIKKDF